MTDLQLLITTGLLSLGTLITRFLPFLLFPEGRKRPAVISYLSQTLPYAIVGLLVVYCLKSVAVTSYPYGIPELICVLLVALLQYKWSNTLLSIAAGTVLYMILVQFVFV